VSTIKLKTKRDLENFLKVLAEESVLAARTAPMREPEEKRQSKFIKQIKQDKAALSEEDPEPAAPAKQEPAAPPAEPPAEKKAPAAPPEPQEKVAELNPSVMDVIDAIKDIRGGMGASDSVIENELRTYFGRLENAEQIALVVMLRSIGEIMRKISNGTDAREPADMNIFTTMKPSETTPAPAEPKTSAAPEKAPSSGPENTAPPIKVGEPVSEAYRARIRDLLRMNQG
jgi:hypothetical protein